MGTPSAASFSTMRSARCSRPSPTPPPRGLIKEVAEDAPRGPRPCGVEPARRNYVDPGLAPRSHRRLYALGGVMVGDGENAYARLPRQPDQLRGVEEPVR